MTASPRSDFHGQTLRKREAAGFAFRETVHKPGIRVSKHSHERAHVAFVMSGALTETCERKTLECRPLSVSFLAPGLTHADDYYGGARSFLMDIAPSRLERLGEVLPMREPLYSSGGVPAWLMMRLCSEARETDGASALAMEGLALEVLAALAREQSTSNVKPPRWLTHAKELLHSHFPQAMTHDDLAKVVGVHPVYLASMFRKYFQYTIGEYVRRLRIEYASRRLAGSDASLVEIALAAGFADQSHFSKVFKRIIGATPGHFRSSLGNP